VPHLGLDELTVQRTQRKVSTMMTQQEINELLQKRGISVSAFWQHAMGGDVAPLPKAVVLRLIRELKKRKT